MSRYCNDGESDMPAVFWHIDLQRALTSGRGQRILRDILDGLIAMPEWRLVYGEVIERAGWDDDEDEPIPGTACAVGAYAAWQLVKAGRTWEEAIRALAADGWIGEHDEWDTEHLGRSAGLARTVAWTLGWLNDEKFGDLTPEERWHAVFGWVWQQVRVAPMPVASP